MKQTNRKESATLQHLADALILEQLALNLAKLARKMQQAALEGRADWMTAGSARHIRQRALEVVCLPLYTADGSEADLEARVLAEATTAAGRKGVTL